MDSLLFLAHRLPYPPNKGDKVRSYHFLKHLAGRFRVFLGTFIDDPDDWRHVEALRGLCAEMHVEPLVPWSKRVVSAAGLLRGEALTLGYFRNRHLHRWVRDVAGREPIARAFAFSSPMAQYALDLPGVRCYIDMVDMDSLKWAQYARRNPWPMSALYAREARRLLGYERKIAMNSEASIFVTQEEGKLFCDAAPECAARVVTIGNGVDSEYFSPSPDSVSPYAPGERPIVFTGAMDYWPNVDAVSWFARDVLPEIRRRDAAARFYIVGMNPASAVQALASEPGVVVTGRVDDVRSVSATCAGRGGTAPRGARNPEQGPRGNGDGKAGRRDAADGRRHVRAPERGGRGGFHRGRVRGQVPAAVRCRNGAPDGRRGAREGPPRLRMVRELCASQ